MSEKERLQKTISEARNELSKIEEKERTLESQELVGQHYKVRNSYGGDNEGWWLYVSVLSVGEFGWLETLDFQDDENGKLEIETHTRVGLYNGHNQIGNDEYKEALSDFLKKVNKIAEKAN